nr:MAG TPA: hypothetical protein [Caudoviricetes sp.]
MGFQWNNKNNVLTLSAFRVIYVHTKKKGGMCNDYRD